MITLKNPELFSFTSPQGREHYYDPIIFWQEYGNDIPEPKKQPTEKEAAEYMKFRHTRIESNEWDKLGGWDRYEFLRRRYDWRDIVTGKEGQKGLKSPDGKILLPEIFHTVARQTMSLKYSIEPVPVFNGEGWGLVLPGDNPVMLTDFIYKDIIKDRWGDSVYLVQSMKTDKWGALRYIETYLTNAEPINRRPDNRIKILREILPLEYDDILEDEMCGPCASTTLWIFRKDDKFGILNSYSRSECLYDGYDIDAEEGIITLYQGTNPVNYTKAFKSVF